MIFADKEKPHLHSLKKLARKTIYELDTTLVAAQPTMLVKKDDIIVSDSVSLRNWCYEHFARAIRFRDNGDFFFNGSYQTKIVYYSNKVKFGFYAALFHEIAHAISISKETALYNQHPWRIAETLVEKQAWETAKENLAIFHAETNINLIPELPNAWAFAQYANAHIVSYISRLRMQYAQKNWLNYYMDADGENQ